LCRLLSGEPLVTDVCVSIPSCAAGRSGGGCGGFFLLWLPWLVLIVSQTAGEVLADWHVSQLLRSWPETASEAFLHAFVAEILVGLPLFFILKRIGWLSPSAFLAGGCALAFVLYVLAHGTQLPAPRYIATAVVPLFVPACIGALVFGYTGRFLTDSAGIFAMRGRRWVLVGLAGLAAASVALASVPLWDCHGDIGGNPHCHDFFAAKHVH
jgi:hypothetical protein